MLGVFYTEPTVINCTKAYAPHARHAFICEGMGEQMADPNSTYIGSRVGLWNARYENVENRKMYDDPHTAGLAGEFLRHETIQEVEDWGCGYGGFKEYLAPHQRYIGVDGSQTPFAERIVDLETYRSDVDAIHLRHVLEHNINWHSILSNALLSFKKRMVLTLFTPFVEETCIINQYEYFGGSNITMVDVAFRRDDIVSLFGGLKWESKENINTKTQYKVEHVFFLSR